MTDLVLANATLVDGRRVDVFINDGLIESVDAADATGATTPSEQHNLGGALLLPAFAEPHAHLDKALSGDRITNRTRDLMGAIDAWIGALPSITITDMIERANTALDMYIGNGVTAIPTHPDIGEGIGLRSVEALTDVRDTNRADVDIEICGLIMYPLAGTAGSYNRRLLTEAIDLGLDLVGGVPALDPDPAANIATTLDAAEEASLPVDLHIDETIDPDVLTLEVLARQVIDRGFPNPITASHCVSLGMQTPARQREVAMLVAEAGISVIANPQTNLFLQGWGVEAATPRGLTAIEALHEAGVTVAGGGDNVQDPFNLVGRADPLETASLLVSAGHLSPIEALAAVSSEARRVMGLSTTIETGNPADLVAVTAPSTQAAIASGGTARRTYKAGRLTGSSEQSVRRFRG
ncbi:MAG TPA: hydrolase [Actinobacteria bacterium]|nr:hydrolase [Actinomycetota bacterium]